MMRKIQYKQIRALIFILGLVGMIGGSFVSALLIRTEAEAMDFVIDADTVRKYGYFEDICETELTGTILKPIDDLDPDEKRPCVFVFHGMFLNRYMQMQTAMYFAKAGMYVVLFDDPGQGESSGCYRLGYELEAIGQTAIDYFIAEGFEKYDMNVDMDALGVNGHSYGGITSTYAGINKPDKIKAVAAIWTWSELPQTIADITMGLGADFDDFLDSQIFTFLTQLTGFGDALYYDREGGYSTDPDDIKKTIEDRNTLQRVSYTDIKPPNYLLIAAYNEEIITADQLMELMTAASLNASGTLSEEDLYDEIEGQIDDKEVWSNLDHENPDYQGNFGDKTARKLYLPKDTEPFGHMMEGLMVSSYVAILEWFGDAFDWNVEDTVKELEEKGISTENIEALDGELPHQAIFKFGAWVFALLALIIAFPAIISYLIRLIKFKNSEEEYQEFIQSYVEPESDKFQSLEVKLLGMLIAVYFVAELFSVAIPLAFGITPKLIGIPFIITDALILIMLGRFLIVAPVVVTLSYIYFKKSNIRLSNMGIPSKKEIIYKDVLIGISISLIFLIVFNLISVFTISPRLMPRRSPTIGYLGYFLLAVYLFIFFFFDELIFRGSIQTKIHHFIYSKLQRRPNWLKKWVEFFLAAIFQGTILLVGVNVGLIIALGGIPPILVSAFLFAGIAVSFIPAILSTYIYQRTKSIIPCIISSALIMTFILGGSFIGALTF